MSVQITDGMGYSVLISDFNANLANGLIQQVLNTIFMNDRANEQEIWWSISHSSLSSHS